MIEEEVETEGKPTTSIVHRVVVPARIYYLGTYQGREDMSRRSWYAIIKRVTGEAGPVIAIYFAEGQCTSGRHFGLRKIRLAKSGLLALGRRVPH